MDLASSHHFLSATYVHPVLWPASALLAGFKVFFSLVLLQQLFASVRRGKLLSETIAEFWSPHEPIAERARLSLPQHGVGAVRPLLLSLRSIEFLTKEQREQLPGVLASIGPAALPVLTRHLHDAHENVRAVAVGAIGHLHTLESLPALVKLSRDRSEWVRQSLAEALGQIGGANWGLARRRRLLPPRAGRAGTLDRLGVLAQDAVAPGGRGRADRPGRRRPCAPPWPTRRRRCAARRRGAGPHRRDGGAGGRRFDRLAAATRTRGALPGGRVAGQGGRAAGSGGRALVGLSAGRQSLRAGGGGPDAGVAQGKGG